MPKQIEPRKKGFSSELRRQRLNQVIFGALAIIVILSWIVLKDGSPYTFTISRPLEYNFTFGFNKINSDIVGDLIQIIRL